MILQLHTIGGNRGGLDAPGVRWKVWRWIPIPFDQTLNAHLVKWNCNQKYGIIRSQRRGERAAGGKFNLIYSPHFLLIAANTCLQLSTGTHSFPFKTYKKWLELRFIFFSKFVHLNYDLINMSTEYSGKEKLPKVILWDSTTGSAHRQETWISWISSSDLNSFLLIIMAARRLTLLIKHYKEWFKVNTEFCTAMPGTGPYLAKKQLGSNLGRQRIIFGETKYFDSTLERFPRCEEIHWIKKWAKLGSIAGVAKVEML